MARTDSDHNDDDDADNDYDSNVCLIAMVAMMILNEDAHHHDLHHGD